MKDETNTIDFSERLKRCITNFGPHGPHSASINKDSSKNKFVACGIVKFKDTDGLKHKVISVHASDEASAKQKFDEKVKELYEGSLDKRVFDTSLNTDAYTKFRDEMHEKCKELNNKDKKNFSFDNVMF